MNFIKQIFKGDVDNKTHQKFIKYGRGKFPGPVLEVTKQAKNIKVKGSFDYAEILGELIAKNADGNFNVTGKIMSKNSLDDELSDFSIQIQKKTKKRKLNVYQIKTEVGSEILKKLYDLDAYVLLSIAPVEKINFKLKTKAAPPKPGGGIDDNFCSAVFDVTKIDEILNELLFDAGDIDIKNFKKINVSHEYIINELIIPEEFKDKPEEIRTHAKRKGGIIRKIAVDDGEILKEGEMLV